MEMAWKDGQILIKKANNNQFLIMKSWGKLKWDKKEQMFYSPADAELLNKLAELVKLPSVIEQHRQQLNKVAQAVDRERLNPDPIPFYAPPIKGKLFRHQIRAMNMCLLTFGLIEPQGKGSDSL